MSHVSSSGQSVAFRDMLFLPLACAPSTWTVLSTHLPRSSSCSALSPISVPQHRCASGEQQCLSSLPFGVDPSQVKTSSQCPLISRRQTLGRGLGPRV